MQHEVFDWTLAYGEFVEITSLEQVPVEDRDSIPYSTDERVDDDYFDFDETIESFLTRHGSGSAR